MLRSLHRVFALFVIVLALTLIFPSVSRASSIAPLTGSIASAYDLIQSVNSLRVSYGLTPYSVSPILMGTAQGHADYMSATGQVSHTGQGGMSVTERLLAAGYPLAGDLSLGGLRSENITAGDKDMSPQDAVNQWMGDSVHLNTMISSSLTEIGAGVANNNGRVYYVIDCAQPTKSSVAPVGTSIAGDSTSVSAAGVVVPVVVVTPNAEGDVIHEVKAGQSLWQIAIAYETKIDEIKRLNNLPDNNIYPGDRLLIRNDVGISATATQITATVEAVLPPVARPTMTAKVMPTLTVELIGASSHSSNNSIMGIAIGIIALAFLGGGILVRLGSSRKSDPS